MTAVFKGTVLIAPIGDFDGDILRIIEKMVPDTFNLPCRIEPLIEDIRFSWNAERDQFHSTAILAKLTDNAPGGIFKILALTHADLFIPILTHVYGEAELGGTSCIVSTFRLCDGISPTNDRNRYLDRILKECAHELGHTFDLRHCKDNQCLMHYCRSISDVDGKMNQFCRYCKVMLEDELKRAAS